MECIILITWGQMGIVEPIDFVLDEFGSDYFYQVSNLQAISLRIIYGVCLLLLSPSPFGTVQIGLRKQVWKYLRTWDEWYDAALALTSDTDGDGQVDRYGSVLGIAEGWPFDDLRASNADYWYAADGSCTIGEKTVETLDFLHKLFYDTCYPGFRFLYERRTACRILVWLRSYHGNIYFFPKQRAGGSRN